MDLNSCVGNVLSVPVPVATTSAKAPLAEALRRMRSEGIHHLVVLEADAILGTVSDRDILARGTDADGISLKHGANVGDVMIRPAHFATETMSLRDTLVLLAESGTSALPIVGRLGLLGIITESDLLKAMRLSLSTDVSPKDARAGGRVVLSNPLIQEAMQILLDVGL